MKLISINKKISPRVHLLVLVANYKVNAVYQLK